jgi:hypothetical protein
MDQFRARRIVELATRFPTKPLISRLRTRKGLLVSKTLCLNPNFAGMAFEFGSFARTSASSSRSVTPRILRTTTRAQCRAIPMFWLPYCAGTRIS